MSATSAPAQTSPALSAQDLQALVDRAAILNGVILPGHSRPQWQSDGFQLNATVHRLDNEIHLNGHSSKVTVTNTFAEILGQLSLQCHFIPQDAHALPGIIDSSERFDPVAAQRFSLSGSHMNLPDPSHSLELFGTGRTFPTVVGGRTRLLAGAIVEILSGTGAYAKSVGNLILAGEINHESGFSGNVLIRIADPEQNFLSHESLPEVQGTPLPQGQPAYLSFLGQKGSGPNQDNEFSLSPDGAVRGLNIPTTLRAIKLRYQTSSHSGIQYQPLQPGADIGREVGFGRGSVPEAAPTGTSLQPYPFEGVADYSFFSPDNWTLGNLQTNVLEGRRFDLPLEEAPGELSWRFGFFGPITKGGGCFRNAKGLFYGASASIFRPPPDHHLVTHFYSALILDPQEIYREHSL